MCLNPEHLMSVFMAKGSPPNWQPSFVKFFDQDPHDLVLDTEADRLHDITIRRGVLNSGCCGAFLSFPQKRQ